MNIEKKPVSVNLIYNFALYHMEIGVKVPGNMRLNESACDHGRYGRAFNGPGL